MSNKNHHFTAEEAKRVEQLLRSKLRENSPDPHFRDALFGKLVQQHVVGASGAKQPKESFFSLLSSFFIHSSLRLGMAAFVICVIGTTTTYAYISPEVTRESNLYFLKRMVESVELNLSSGEESRAQTYLKLADRRLQEAQILWAMGVLDEETLSEIALNTQEAHLLAGKVDDAKARSLLNMQVIAQSSDQREILLQMIEELLPSEDGDLAEDGDAEAAQGKVNTVASLDDAVEKIAAVEIELIEEQVSPAEDAPYDISIQFAASPPAAVTSRNVSFVLLIQTKNSVGSEEGWLQISWGDGQAEGVALTPQYGDRSIEKRFSHTYRNDGQYHISAKVTSPEFARELTTANNRVAQKITILTDPDCSAGARRCSGSAIQECQLSNGWDPTWITVSTCSSGSVCSAGQCVAPSSVCGNGVIEQAEECDDGNTANGDGCTGSCAIEITCDSLRKGDARHFDVCRESGYDNVCFSQGGIYFGCTRNDNDTCTKNNEYAATNILCPISAVCGNGIREKNEECDDGNTRDNDGCNMYCKSEQCTDTDGGLDGFVRGVVNHSISGIRNQSDFCITSNELMEHRCSAGSVLTNKIVCEYGCSEGACRRSPVVCGDGTREGNEQCDDGNTHSNDGCSSSCYTEGLCSDTDNGKNYATRGFASTMQGGGNGQGSNDYCLGNDILVEYSCSGYAILSEQYTCPYGCSLGACKPQPAAVCGNRIKEGSEECDIGAQNGKSWCSASCTKQCYDHDSGIDFYTKGRVEVSTGTAWDVCDGNRIKEYYCQNDQVQMETFDCPYGCYNGTCLPEPQSLCGNGSVDEGEQCDDGNTIDRDGCSQTCRIEVSSDIKITPGSLVAPAQPGSTATLLHIITTAGPDAPEVSELHINLVAGQEYIEQWNQGQSYTTCSMVSGTIICTDILAETSIPLAWDIATDAPCGSTFSYLIDAIPWLYDPNMDNNQRIQSVTIECPQ